MKRLLTILLFVLTFATISMAQSNPPLTIREVDGSPRKVNATELVFPNGTLTVSAGKVTFTAATSGTVTSVSVVTANGISGSVANPTTTPAITLTVQNAAADGSTKGIASFTAADFDASSGNISLDYTNAQKATGSVPGFLSAADWTTFNAKQAALGFTPENSANKDATGGYAGLTLFKIDFKNAANTFTSFFTNANSAARTYTFQNRDGTIADDTDLALKESTANKDAASGYAGLTAGSLLKTAEFPPFTGDLTTTSGGVVTVFATVNGNVGTFGSATQSSQVTVNAKGLVTAAANVTITPAFSSLTGKPTTFSGYSISDTSANLRAALTDENGTGVALFDGSTGAIFISPALGTPASGVATNLTGTASGLTAGNVTTNANLTGDVTSVGNSTTLTNAPVIAKVLTGYVSGAGTVASTDSILQAFQKINGNVALNAPIASPTFTGTPAAPTAAVDTSTTQIATTAFVINQAYAKLASPTLTGVPAAPTAAVDTSTTQLATTAYVINQAYAKLASPTFTGTPTLPTGTIGTTQSAGNSTTALATTAFVTTADNLKANLAGPTFTGTVTIPTPFTIGAVSMTATGTQLNYLNAATGTTGTTSTNVVFSTSPTLVTPALGVATATSINGLIISTTTGTFTLTNAKTLSVSNTLTFTGTDSSSVAFGAGGTVLYTNGSGASLTNVVNSITGTSNQVVASGATGAVTLSLPQSIATASTPQFLRMGLNQAADATASLALTQTALGSTSTDGIVLQNTTAAAAGAQQWSPRNHRIAQGWKTDATAASRTIDWIDEVVPLQGAAAPTSYLGFSSQTNGGGYTRKITFMDISSTISGIGFGGGTFGSQPEIYSNGSYLALNAVAGANTLYLNNDAGSTSFTDLQGMFKVAGTGTITFNTTVYNTCSALTTTAGVVVCTVSDERVKQNISPFSNRGLGIIREIQPITFSFKRDTPYFDGRSKLGLSAQNLRNANPLLASSTGNVENLLQPEPLALHAVEIDAIKALDARVEAQQLLINELRTRVARLESRR